LDRDRLDHSVSEATGYLLRKQHEQGYWLGTLHNDSSVTGLYVLLALYTGWADPEKQKKAVRYLLEQQTADGGWEQYPGSGGNLDATLINYTALRASGCPADNEALRRAYLFACKNGGVDRANFFTKIFLALFGQVPWKEIPWITCRLIQNDDLIYREGFPRIILIPYMVLYENRMVMDLPDYFQNDEYPTPRKGVPGALRLRHEDAETPVLDRWNDPENRDRCIQWILSRQERDGTWAGIVQATAFNAMALASCQRETYSDALKHALRGVESFQVETEETLMQPFSQGPVMDTAHSIRALLLAGIPGEAPALQRAVQWLLDQQSLREGDWKFGNPDGEPGGWPFEFHNSWYPDVDDTAMVLTGLSLLELEPEAAAWLAMDRGILWLLSMQNPDGGFPVWDRGNWIVLNVLKPLFDVGDYSHADVTARVLVALGSLKSLKRYSFRQDMDRAILNARRFLLRDQKNNGSWYGRWGANYTYGTGQVLEGLLATGSSPADPPIRKAVTWLLGVQNTDGGWGESLQSYQTGRYEPGESTVAQSATVLRGLLHAGDPTDPRFLKGIRYLLHCQQPDGSWQDHLFYAVNVPKAWYGRYELLSTHAALMLLAEYRGADRTDD